MKTTITLILCLISMALKVNASHITGAELTVKYIAPETYEVSLIIYRDCTSLQYFDDPAYFTIFNAVTNEFILNFEIYSPVIVAIPIDSVCFDTLPEICIERAIYTDTINLPDIIDGYYFVYQRCCWSYDIINVVGASDIGMTLYQKIEGTGPGLGNNSPLFNINSPSVICLNEPIYIDHTASDVDGDSLSYSLFGPLVGADYFNPNPEIASPPPYAELPYTAGFSSGYPISMYPALNINPTTGIITGTPNSLGKYIIGIVVEEFRDGILLSQHFRIFTFYVQDCSAYYEAFLTENIEQCGDKEVHFANYSEGADTYFWDFGDGNNSAEIEPVHLYDDYGVYNVFLIAQPGDVCADTAYSIITLTESDIDATIVFDGTTLTASAGDAFQWYLNGALIPGATSQTFFPLEEGNYSVEIIIGVCSDKSEELFVLFESIGTLLITTINFYPNPNWGDALLISSNYVNQPAALQILNTIGQIISFEEIILNGSNEEVLNLPEGIYFIKLFINDGVKTQQLIVY